VDASLLLPAFVTGAVVGFVSGAFGKGGSAVATPLLHLAGVPAVVAVASPLPATVPAALVAGRTYARRGHVDFAVVRIAIAAGVPATVAGALSTHWIPGSALVLATDVLVLVLGLHVLAQLRPGARAHSKRGTEPVHRARTVVALAVAVGLVSGLLGNSGGFLLAPLLMHALHLPLHRALGTSLAIAAAFAVPGTIVHASLGHVDWALAAVFGAAAIPCAGLGARVAVRVRERPLRLAFGAGLTLVAGTLVVFAR
jgi:hypothetical protein